MAYKKTLLLFCNKNNKIVIKLNNNTSIEKLKKQTLKKFAQKIDVYRIKNNIITIKLCEA